LGLCQQFRRPGKPIAIELPAGRARTFQDAIHKLIDDLKAALPAVFQSEDYQIGGGHRRLILEEPRRGLFHIA
jgi:hypothetical protein